VLPDHLWLKEHPGWFSWRPDGTIRYAENPPKKYQDIVNVDFYAPDAIPSLWLELRDVVLGWVEEGVKIFRVDNPHTKPLPFWQWMIADIRAQHPDVMFLAEAFTKPAMMARLGKVGYSQSYTYFTWRNTKAELPSISPSSTSRRGASATGRISSSTRRTSTRISCMTPVARASDSSGAGDHGLWPVGHVFGVRAVRIGACAGQRRVSGFREIRNPASGLHRAGQHHRRDRSAQPYPPAEPGAADPSGPAHLQRLERQHSVLR
jgi:hypothetical protein